LLSKFKGIPVEDCFRLCRRPLPARACLKASWATRAEPIRIPSDPIWSSLGENGALKRLTRIIAVAPQLARRKRSMLD
jgi:hypothetical protein